MRRVTRTINIHAVKGTLVAIATTGIMPFAAHAATDMGSLTSITLSNTTPVTLSGYYQPTKFGDAYTPAPRTAGLGTGTFTWNIPDDAVAGDTFDIVGHNGAAFTSTLSIPNVNDASGQVIATGKLLSQGSGVQFTYTNYVDTHTGVSATYTSSLSAYESLAPNREWTTAGSPYQLTYRDSTGTVTATRQLSTLAPYMQTDALRTSPQANNTIVATSFDGVYHQTPELTNLTFSTDLGTFDCAYLQTQLAAMSGFGVWTSGPTATKQMMKSRPLAQIVTSTPTAAGQLYLKSCTATSIEIETFPGAQQNISFDSMIRIRSTDSTAFSVMPTFSIVGKVGNTVVFEKSSQPYSPANNADGTGTISNPAVTLAKSVDKAEAHLGDTLTYALTVTNSGDVPITPALIDTMCQNMTPATLGSIDPGKSSTATCTHIVTADDLARGTLTNTATATDQALNITANASASTKIISAATPSQLKPSHKPAHLSHYLLLSLPRLPLSVLSVCDELSNSFDSKNLLTNRSSSGILCKSYNYGGCSSVG